MPTRRTQKPPAGLVQTGLRIRCWMRDSLAREAERNGLSLNDELARRLEKSLDADQVRGLDEITADLKKVSNRLHAMA
jgi:hypothetical protein